MQHDKKPTAKRYLRRSVLLAAAFFFGMHATAEVTTDDERIEMKQTDASVDVHIDGQLFTKLHYKDLSKPYLYPIVGPTGSPMTRGFPMKQGLAGESKDHPHHQSLWFAHGNINGVDYWHSGGDRGYTVVQGKPEIDGNRLFFKSRLLPRNDAEKMQAEFGTHLSISVAEDGTRAIDYDVRFAVPEAGDALTFRDTKEGTMALRMHPALRLKGDVATGHCINSEGDRDGKAWGKRAKWVAYWGQIDGKTVGIAMFDHPSNLRHPTWWHARDYGLLAANPFGAHDFSKAPRGAGDWTLKPGNELRFFYRIVFFQGTVEEADVAGKYDAWVQANSADHHAE